MSSNNGNQTAFHKTGKMWLIAGTVALLGVAQLPNAVYADDATYTVQQTATQDGTGTIYTATADAPGTPGQVIDASKSTTALWPDGTDQNSLQKTVNQVVHYVYQGGVKDGEMAAPDSTDSVTFSRTASITVANPVPQKTMQIKYVEAGTDVVLAHQETITAPVGSTYELKPKPIAGYTLIMAVGGTETGTLASDTSDITYYYYKTPEVTDENGDVVTEATTDDPVDPNVKYVSVTPLQPKNEVSTVTYSDWAAENNDNSFDAVTSPIVPGYTATEATIPAVTNMDETSESQEKTVHYSPNTQHASVTYVDDTTGDELAKDEFAGLSDEKMSYSTASKIADYQAQGYELVSNDYSDGTAFDTDDATDQPFVVHLKKVTDEQDVTSEASSESVTSSESSSANSSESNATSSSVSVASVSTESMSVASEENIASSVTTLSASVNEGTLAQEIRDAQPQSPTTIQTIVKNTSEPITVAGVLPYTATTQQTVSGVLPYTELPTTAAEKQTKPWVAIGIGVATALSLFAIGTLIANKRRQ
ncbi:mucin-binding protein [Weissella confusa]|uniref:mucin-binding protein n=1 Tax=Weissella confusa TaxID=1583 RepID=UPI0022E2A7B3|nr:MucBP domain-containing protein [Weissella confusa]